MDENTYYPSQSDDGKEINVLNNLIDDAQFNKLPVYMRVVTSEKYNKIFYNVKNFYSKNINNISNIKLKEEQVKKIENPFKLADEAQESLDGKDRTIRDNNNFKQQYEKSIYTQGNVYTTMMQYANQNYQYHQEREAQRNEERDFGKDIGNK